MNFNWGLTCLKSATRCQSDVTLQLNKDVKIAGLIKPSNSGLYGSLHLHVPLNAVELMSYTGQRLS